MAGAAANNKQQHLKTPKITSKKSVKFAATD
jgi:hypothetical protein